MKISKLLEAFFAESISYDYVVPKNDFIKQIYDFYLWTLFYSTIKNKDAEKSIQLKPGWDEDTYEDLKNIVIKSTGELVDYLQEELIEFLCLAISSEISHAFIPGVDDSEYQSNQKGGLGH